MRRLTIAIAIAFACALFACGTETIELVDVGPRDVGIQDAEPEDMGPADTGVEDLGVEDLGTRDAEPEDLGTRDAEPEDLGTPDSGTEECECRQLNCADDPACETAIGAGSTCDMVLGCTGFRNTCRLTSDCDPGLTCTPNERDRTECR